MENAQETQNLIAERYTELPEEVRDLFELDIITNTALMIEQQYGLNEEKRVMLENHIALVLLAFFPKNELSTRLTESLRIPADKASRIVQLVENEIFDLIPDYFEALDAFIQESVETTEQEPVEPPPVEAELEKPSIMDQLEKLRTMQGDAERIHGYGAYRRRNTEDRATSQSNTAPLTPPPRYVDPEEKG